VRHLNDAGARGRIALQVRANEIRTGRKIAKDEAAVSIGYRERAGAAERRNDNAGSGCERSSTTVPRSSAAVSETIWVLLRREGEARLERGNGGTNQSRQHCQ
jgi:hypothetical protein